MSASRIEEHKIERRHKVSLIIALAPAPNNSPTFVGNVIVP
jgi:hypothetical protein